MQFGNLEFVPARKRLDLVGRPVSDAIERHNYKDVYVAEIDPTLADTAAFCEKYNVGLGVSANCVIVEAKRAERTWYAACMILATSRADVNNVVRRHLDARKISFAPVNTAVTLTGMEYGGINPIGLPADWPILVDEQAPKLDWAIIGSGLRKSKLLVPGTLLTELSNTVVLDIAKKE